MNQHTSVGEDVENPCALLVGMHIGAATEKNSMEGPQKIKYETALGPSDSTAENISKDT